MQALFAPFIRVMNLFKYGQKFVVLTLLFLIPISIMLTLLIGSYNRETGILEAERRGVTLIQAATPLMLSIQEHRGAANGYLNGDQGVLQKMTAAAATTDENVAVFQSLIDRYSETYDLAERWDSTVSEWHSLKTQVGKLTPEESFQRHSDLIDKLIVQLADVSDKTGLSLSGRLDTNYLAMMASELLPVIMEKTARVRGQGTGVLASKKISGEQKVTFMLAEENIVNASRQMVKSQQSVMKFNPELQQMEQSAQESSKAALDFTEIIRKQFIDPANLNVKPSDFFDAGTSAILAASQLSDEATAHLDRLLAEQLSETSRIKTMMLTILAASLLLALLLFTGFYFSVHRAVRELSGKSRLMAHGDLTVTVDLQTKDELSAVGRSFNEMADNIRKLLHSNVEMAGRIAASTQQLRTMSESTIEATEEIAESAMIIATGAESQVRSAEDTARSMEEMAAGIQRIAETTSSVSDLANQASYESRSGGEILGDAVMQMQAINKTVGESAVTIHHLGSRSEEIAVIVTEISEISAQTHMLSLNAAIEAARAGEHGRGFSVVASEIRKLSEKCSQSADSISRLVEDIVLSVEKAVAAMDGGMHESDKGIQAMEKVSHSFHGILSSVNQVAAQIQEVSAATEQLSAGTEQIASTTSETSDIAQTALGKTQNVSSSSEELLSSMEEVQAVIDSLNELAEKLTEEMSSFQV